MMSHIQRLFDANDIRFNMGKKGDFYSSARSESFFHTLKVEAIHEFMVNGFDPAIR